MYALNIETYFHQFIHSNLISLIISHSLLAGYKYIRDRPTTIDIQHTTYNVTIHMRWLLKTEDRRQ